MAVQIDDSPKNEQYAQREQDNGPEIIPKTFALLFG